MQNAISQAKAALLQAKEQMAHSLAATPDDRINWSPSPTSRTPIQQVAHAAQSVKTINRFLNGRPFEIKTTLEADKAFRSWEAQFTTREQVLDVLEQNCADYAAWLDALTPERFESMAEMPFGMGSMPVAAAIGFPADHMRWHIAQIDYIQTVYGDLDWHM